MTEYETYMAALAAARTASATFRVAQIAYREGRIGDAEYLAARTTWEESDVTFDVAYAKYEATTAEPAVAP